MVAPQEVNEGGRERVGRQYGSYDGAQPLARRLAWVVRVETQ